MMAMLNPLDLSFVEERKVGHHVLFFEGILHVLTVKPLSHGCSSFSQIEAGCDVPEIIRSMSAEQRDHEHMIFGPTYIKVSAALERGKTQI